MGIENGTASCHLEEPSIINNCVRFGAGDSVSDWDRTTAFSIPWILELELDMDLNLKLDMNPNWTGTGTGTETATGTFLSSRCELSC